MADKKVMKHKRGPMRGYLIHGNLGYPQGKSGKVTPRDFKFRSDMFPDRSLKTIFEIQAVDFRNA